MSWFEVDDEQARALRLAWDVARDRTPRAREAHEQGALASSLGMPASAVAWRQLAEVHNQQAAG